MTAQAIGNEVMETALGAERTGASELDTLYVGLVRDYHRRIYNYVFRLVGDDSLAEDLTQDTYLRAFRGLPRLPAGANHRAWLFRIATNAATDELRRRGRRPTVRLAEALAARLPSSARTEDERLGRVVLQGALLEVEAHHRVVLMLFEFAGFSAPEVGEVLGISPETARKRRQRARKALAEHLQGPGR
jgi:RNA polymerase sigma-70 factor (ECF subfamily)